MTYETFFCYEVEDYVMLEVIDGVVQTCPTCGGEEEDHSSPFGLF